MKITRRDALRAFGALSLANVFGSRGLALALADADIDSRLVVIFLRGALDGLAAAPAYGDPDFERERRGMALPAPGEEGGVLKLDSMFAVHPRLPVFQELYRKAEMTLVQAVASPYRERSHFDGQNALENGSGVPYQLKTGWLNRALEDLPETGRDLGVAINNTMPVLLRGNAPVTSWYPSDLPQPDPDIIERVERLYRYDPELHAIFDKAKVANAMMGGAGTGASDFPELARAAGTFLKEPNGPRVAMLESSGWDTHAGQSGDYNTLYFNLIGLNDGVEALVQELGPVWSQTVVLVMTEFGRTVAMNGSNGTDHGTGGAAFLLGGAVAGGKVVADWPGLKAKDQYEGRDLMPTLDVRAVVKGVLRDHLGIREAHIENRVFPGSGGARAVDRLIRSS